MNNSLPKVSIICLTYNQEKYIARALEGFVMQTTNFNFEVIVHDDASSDRTPEIIKYYQLKYPNIIKPIFETKNQFSQKKDILYSKDFLAQIKGKYVALCEGDDYWTDNRKLQIQADYLDRNPDVTICFHPVKVEWEDNIYPSKISPRKKKYFTFEKLLKANFIQTNSVMYRWCIKPEMYAGWLLPGDWYLHLLHAKRGRIGYINKVMSVYYRNLKGIWTYKDRDEFYLKNWQPFLAFFKAVEKNFLCDESENIKDLIEHVVSASLRKGDLETVKCLFSDYKNYLILYNPTERINRKVKKIKFVNSVLIVLMLLMIVFVLLFLFP